MKMVITNANCLEIVPGRPFLSGIHAKETLVVTNCVNFWVFPQRLFYIGRRFGTHGQVHLQRLEVSVYYSSILQHIITTKMQKKKN
jgi:hypothetical protein